MRLHTFFATLVFSLLCTHQAAAAGTAQPQKLLLWPDGAPGTMANGGDETVRVTEQGDHVVSNVHRPSLTPYLPKGKHSGVSVIVVPGGGHRELWTDHEGHNEARFLSEHGIAAFVLQYRLARAPNSTYTIEGDALNDLKRAIRTVRSNAAWSADTRLIGVMGFSAGGQLAALGATGADAGDPAAKDPIERAASRLNFAALIYPGTWPDLKIGADTPPMFLLCGGDDRPEVVTGITNIFLKLRESKVPAELHVYDHVAHGFGMRATLTGPVASWPQQFVDWLYVSKFVEPTK
ncbi:MAG TPA: alpha/beta hydrolase [Steroidobacteraceae bacterium]|nr:alpha/beta hydrolase [Steroidobacteraceae bacterium]